MFSDLIVLFLCWVLLSTVFIDEIRVTNVLHRDNLVFKHFSFPIRVYYTLSMILVHHVLLSYTKCVH